MVFSYNLMVRENNNPFPEIQMLYLQYITSLDKGIQPIVKCDE